MKIVITLLFLLAVSSGCRDSGRIARRSTAPQFLTHAKRFEIEKNEDFTRLTILNPWQGTSNVTMEYFLIERGSPVPEGIDTSAIIYVPVRSAVCMSVTHVAMLSALGETGSIAAVSGTRLVYSEDFREIMETKYIPDVGYEAGLNSELILKISPDVVFMYGIGGESAGYTGKIEELGIRVVFIADYLETDPLARAEWIKLFGALYIKEVMADSIFNSECDLYNSISEKTSELTHKPKVLLGLPYKDSWFISPGNSYISRLIQDAGGEYLWSKTEANESMPLGLENVYLRALKADFWLNTGTALNKSEITAVDPRFAELPCFTSGNIFNNNKRINQSGGNDYWETGTLHPHLILQDLSTILHPELAGTNNELFFYRKLE